MADCTLDRYKPSVYSAHSLLNELTVDPSLQNLEVQLVVDDVQGVLYAGLDSADKTAMLMRLPTNRNTCTSTNAKVRQSELGVFPQ